MSEVPPQHSDSLTKIVSILLEYPTTQQDELLQMLAETKNLTDSERKEFPRNVEDLLIIAKAKKFTEADGKPTVAAKEPATKKGFSRAVLRFMTST